MNSLPSVNDAGPGASVLPPTPAPRSAGEVQFLWSVSSLAAHRVRVARVAAHAARCSDSFRWERRGTDTAEDRVALVSAAGRCGGRSAPLDVKRQTGR